MDLRLGPFIRQATLGVVTGFDSLLAAIDSDKCTVSTPTSLV